MGIPVSQIPGVAGGVPLSMHMAAVSAGAAVQLPCAASPFASAPPAALAIPQASLNLSLVARPENVAAMRASQLGEVMPEAIRDFGKYAISAALPAGTTILDVETNVAKKSGKPLDRATYPELYSIGDGIVGRLGDAFNRLNTSGVAVDNRFAIVDSNEVNAFVHQLAGKGRKKRTNLIYVTTGFLHRFLGGKNGEFDETSVRNGIHCLSGVLAHEMAHPMDHLDPKGLIERYGILSAYQAAEVRADIEAMTMLREARLPTNALLHALEEKFSAADDGDKKDETDIGAAVLNTHPEDELRLSTIKLFLTMNDFERGEGEATPFALDDVHSIAKEAAQVPRTDRSKKADELPLPNPQSLSEAIEMLRAHCQVKTRYSGGRYDMYDLMGDRGLVDAVNWEQNYNLIFNHLVIQVDRFLIERGAGLTEKETSLVLDVNNIVASNMTDNWNTHWGRNHFSVFKGLQKSLGPNSHRELLEGVPFYRTKQYKEWLRRWALDKLEGKQSREFETGSGIGLGSDYNRGKETDISTVFEQLCLIAPPEVALAAITPELKRDLLESAKRGYQHLQERAVSIFTRSPNNEPEMMLEMNIAVAAWFHRHIHPHLGFPLSVQFFLTEKFGLFPSSYMAKLMTDRNTVIASILNAPASRRLKTDYLEFIRHIWDNRGRYGLMELFAGTGRFHTYELRWELIFELLNIDKDTGYKQISEAVKQFTTTKEYADILRLIQAPPDDDMTHTPGYYSTRRDSTTVGNVTNENHWPKSWLGEDLYDHITGRHNPYLQSDPGLRQFVRKFAGSNYLLTHRASMEIHLLRTLKRRISKCGEDISIEDILRIHRNAFEQMTLRNETPKPRESIYSKKEERGEPVIPGIGRPYEDIWARAIAGSSLSHGARKRLLGDIFIRHFHMIKQNLGKGNEDTNSNWFPYDILLYGVERVGRTVLNTLLQQGVVIDVFDLLTQLRGSLVAAVDTHHASQGSGQDVFWKAEFPYFRYIFELTPDLVDDIEKIAASPNDRDKANCIDRLLDIVDPFPWGYKNHRAARAAEPNGGEMRRIKKGIIAVAESLSISSDDEERLFARLTATGATLDTDNYFKRHLLARLTADGTDEQRQRIEKLLLEKRIGGNGLQVELARFVLKPQLEWSGTPISDEELKKLLKRVNELVPARSPRRDELLEEIAWQRGVDDGLISQVENEKGMNWRRINPLLVNALSGGSAWLEGLSPNELMVAIKYIINPGDQWLPPELEAAIDRSFENRAGTSYEFKQEIVSFIWNLSPLEKIPLINLLLNKGDPSMMTEDSYPYNITRGILGYVEDSNEERFLTSALASIPPERSYQRSVVLAYLLAISNEEKRGVKAIFEAFTAVGIKLGQRASIFWTNVPDNVKSELRELKDHARPLTKAEVYRIMDATDFSPAETKRIKRLVRILGSASIRTAVLVELEDGTEAVMLVRRPHAREQIENNIVRVRRLIPELKNQGFEDEVGVIEAFVDGVGEQLTDETDMTREAAILGKAREFYDRMNEDLRAYLGNWRFAVPGLIPGFNVRDHMLFIERMSGGSFDKLPEGEPKRQAGMGIVAAGIRSLMREGFLNADPHDGNYLVDPETNTIGVIDWGEFEEISSDQGAFSADDGYNLIQFLWAVASKDADKVWYYAQRLSDTDPRSNAAAVQVIADEMGPNGDFAKNLIISINSLHRAGVTLPRRILTGAIVGLMILHGEGYVEPRYFKGLLALEAARLLAFKLPRLAMDGAGRRLQGSALYAFGQRLTADLFNQD